MATLDDDAATDLELETIAATLLPLSAAQLKKIQHKLVPERLRATNLDDSMLLRLPQELRDAIYELVLEDYDAWSPALLLIAPSTLHHPSSFDTRSSTGYKMATLKNQNSKLGLENPAASGPLSSGQLQALRASDSENSRLLQLPQELLDQIYDEVLENERPKGFSYTKQPSMNYWCNEARPTSLHPLFRVCHQLREDLAEVFWKNITIYPGENLPIAAKCIANMDPKHKNLIRKVNFDGYFNCRQSAKRAAKYLEVELEFQRGTVWALYKNQSADGRSDWQFNARVNTLGEVEEFELAESEEETAWMYSKGESWYDWGDEAIQDVEAMD
ncbi:hypothetical protein CBER1_08081 [Cercospora berteroae]|uniref:F-box domain-containing protein n=1 Tax=Cercospora berteroae TaxID=357750 RepID=A0A2S6CF86_9PEZI|nr:hypothetical protein CBER1_08081 [Cercospora berteroae]